MKKKCSVIASHIILITSMLIGLATVKKRQRTALEKKKKMSDKHLAQFLLMNQWVKLKQDGKNLSLYLEKRGFHNVAIYGMGYIGITLFDELKGTNINVTYGIDKNESNILLETKVMSPDMLYEKVDAIIVTAIYYYDEIRSELEKKINCPIISLEEIVFSL